MPLIVRLLLRSNGSLGKNNILKMTFKQGNGILTSFFIPVSIRSGFAPDSSRP